MTSHPMQTHSAPREIGESLALRAYEVYSSVYGDQPAMIDVVKGCRGGFSVGEIIAFLYARSFPRNEWPKRVDEALEGMKRW